MRTVPSQRCRCTPPTPRRSASTPEPGEPAKIRTSSVVRTSTSQPSPTPFLLHNTSYLWTVSDPLLAAVNGDDPLPDLALGRLPGWIAQWREMVNDPTNKIGRPRQIYVGATQRDYVPIADR